METVHLPPSVMYQNCSKINWSYSAIDFANDIHRIISNHHNKPIECGKHNYMFLILHTQSPITLFTFPETNMLMQLMPNESDTFYLKAAIREYVNTFEIINAIGDRVYPEDIV